MALDFPNSPTSGQIYTTGSGAWAWDTVKWKGGGGSGFLVFLGDTPPPTPTAGQLWWNSSPGIGQLYVRYDDGTSVQWVVANNMGGGLYLPLSGGTVTGNLGISGTLNVTGLTTLGLATGTGLALTSGSLTVNGVNLVNGLYASTQSNYTAVTNMPTGQTMMGLGNFFNITPKLTGRVLVILTTSIAWNSSAMTGTIQNIYYGTGTPPASKSAPTGTSITLNYQASSATNAAGGSQQEPMTVSAVLTGLTPNTTYWVDLSWNSATAGANIFSSNMTAVEI
jgi:hypothetical protein